MNYPVFLAFPLLLAQTPVLAEAPGGEAESRETTITVLATGRSASIEQVAQPVSIVGRDEIDSVQGADIARVLERLPGVALARNGSLGGFTGLFVRGANSQQVLVLVDGVRVADTAAPSGGYDFGRLMTGPIGKVELLRGSNSVIWGSEAIGGVVAMTSRDVNGFEASAEYGARDSFNADASAGVQRENYGLTLSGGFTRSDGFSSAAAGTEPDGFRQWRVNGRGRVAVTPELSVVAAARYADSRIAFDGFSFAPPFGLIDTPEFTETSEISLRTGLEYARDGIELTAGYAIYDSDRANFDPRFGAAPGFAAKGRQQRAEMKGAWDAARNIRLNFGIDHEWSSYSSTFDLRQSARVTSGHALIGWYGDALNVAAGLRIDDHSGFGSEWTLGANASLRIAGGWRILASYGEGFKVPSLFQLYSDFGNAGLRPESSRSYDIAVQLGDRNARFHLALSLYHRDTRDFIDFVSCFGIVGGICTNRPFGTYDNVGKARAQGAEFEAGGWLTRTLRARIAYTYLKATDRTPGGFNRGNELPRRPRHAASLSGDWETPLAGLSLGGDLRIAGRSFDDAGNSTRLEGYAVATLRAELAASEAVTLFGRIENIGGERYQTVAGYGTSGRSAFIGARARF